LIRFQPDAMLFAALIQAAVLLTGLLLQYIKYETRGLISCLNHEQADIFSPPPRPSPLKGEGVIRVSQHRGREFLDLFFEGEGVIWAS